MDLEANTILNSIKPSLEVNKDLRIKELENENAHLTIQLNKYKKELSRYGKNANRNKHNPTKKEKHNLLLEQQALAKKIKAKYRDKINQLERVKEKYKSEMTKQNNIRLFLQKMIKKYHGADAYIKIMNHVDNPDKTSKFDTLERQEELKKKWQ